MTLNIQFIKEQYFSDTNIYFIQDILHNKYHIPQPQNNELFQLQNKLFNLFLTELHINTDYYSNVSPEHIIITLNKFTIQQYLDTLTQEHNSIHSTTQEYSIIDGNLSHTQNNKVTKNNENTQNIENT